MSVIIGFERSQKQARDEYNEYCTQHREIIADYEAEAMEIADRYEGKEYELAMLDLDNHPRFYRHREEMKRLIANMDYADKREIERAARTGNFEIVDPYWVQQVDHRNPLNPHYEPTKRVVFDMGRGRRHEVGSKRSSVVKITNNPLGQS